MGQELLQLQKESETENLKKLCLQLQKELGVEDLKEKCVYYAISRSQRLSELNIGLEFEGTTDYELTGCFNCDGYQIKCEKYIGW